jgi:hypothetical protein
VEEDEAPRPINVCAFGSDRIAFDPDVFPHLIEEVSEPV